MSIYDRDRKDYCVYTHTFKGETSPFYVGSGQPQRPYTVTSRNADWKGLVAEHLYYDVEVVEWGLSKVEAREKEALLSERVKPRACKMYGSRLSPEEQEKVNKTYLARSSKPVRNCREESFVSQTAAGNEYKTLPSKIGHVCKGLRLSAGRYPDGAPVRWEYTNKDDIEEN